MNSLNSILRPTVTTKKKSDAMVAREQQPVRNVNATELKKEHSINPVAKSHQQPIQVNVAESKIEQSIDHHVRSPQQRTRAERSDKKKDIKFPVTPAQREELRRLARELRIENKDPSRKYETISNTQVLKKALDQYKVFPERFPPLLYSDTGQYMHVEPILRDYEVIEELARKMNLSVRKTVYRLIMNYIYRGEVDSDAYREGR